MSTMTATSTRAGPGSDLPDPKAEVPSRSKTVGSRPAGARQFVSFWVDGQLLGVSVETVQEVLRPQNIAPVPLARPEVSGLLNLRGQIVTAVDLRHRLNLPPRDGDTPPMNVVVQDRNEGFSLLVDEVGDVIDVDENVFEPPARTLDAHWRAIATGVYRLEGQLLVVVDVPKLLSFS